MSVKLLVADDHEVVRAGLRKIFAETDIQVVAEASTGSAAVELVGNQPFDVVLLDVVMPDMDGLSALGRLKIDHPELPVLMFSSHDNPSNVARSVALGAAGFVSKGSPAHRLIAAVLAAANRDTLWTREELRRVTGALSTPRQGVNTQVPLTKRENEVLVRVAKGLTNKEIGQSLEISYETVKEHVQHILRKVGVADRTQAAVWAVRNELA